MSASARTCEYCGEPGELCKLESQHGGSRETMLCAEHQQALRNRNIRVTVTRRTDTHDDAW